jgi:predicted  nucleic acid-binding Zn-ribbon protein
MAISGKRIILANNQALRAKDQNGDVQELLKLDGSGQIAGKVKDYIDAQNGVDQNAISQLQSDASSLDGRLDTVEADMTTKASIAYVGQLEQLRQDADNALDSRIDMLELEMPGKASTGALEAEQTARQNGDQSLQSSISAVDGRVDSLDGSLVSLTGRVTTAETAIANLASSSAITELDGRLDVIEPKVSTLESEMDQAQTDISALQSSVSAKASQADLDDIEAYAQDIRDDHDALEGRVVTAEGEIDALQLEMPNKASASSVSALEGRMGTAEGEIDTLQSDMDAAELAIAGKLDASQKGAANGVAELDATGKVPASQLPVVQSVSAHKMAAMTLSAQQVADGYIDLSHEAMAGSISVFCERMAILEGLDYSVSSSGGVSRLTWSGPSAAGGEEAFAEGDIVYVQYLRSL